MKKAILTELVFVDGYSLVIRGNKYKKELMALVNTHGELINKTVLVYANN